MYGVYINNSYEGKVLYDSVRDSVLDALKMC